MATSQIIARAFARMRGDEANFKSIASAAQNLVNLEIVESWDYPKNRRLVRGLNTQNVILSVLLLVLNEAGLDARGKRAFADYVREAEIDLTVLQDPSKSFDVVFLPNEGVYLRDSASASEVISDTRATIILPASALIRAYREAENANSFDEFAR